MNRMFLWVVLIAAGVLAFIAYRSHVSSSGLDVEPHAKHEIERAKHK